MYKRHHYHNINQTASALASQTWALGMPTWTHLGLNVTQHETFIDSNIEHNYFLNE